MKGLERRTDGVLMPQQAEEDIWVIEFQAQRDPLIYHRLVQEIGLLGERHPKRVVRGCVLFKVADALNDRGKPLKGDKILVLGIAYKKNVDDRRESPSIELMELLQAKGAEISHSDPHVPKFLRMRKHDFDLESVPLTPETLAATDCVLLATDHDRFDYDLIKARAPLIVDTRGRYQQPAENIVKA